MTGWNTAEVTKKEVPDQNASMAVPLSFSVMIGSAILREVASRAAATVIIQIDRNARMKLLVGLKAADLPSPKGGGDEGCSSLRLGFEVDGTESSNFSSLK